MYSELTALLRSQGGKGRAEMPFPFYFANDYKERIAND